MEANPNDTFGYPRWFPSWAEIERLAKAEGKVNVSAWGGPETKDHFGKLCAAFEKASGIKTTYTHGDWFAAQQQVLNEVKDKKEQGSIDAIFLWGKPFSNLMRAAGSGRCRSWRSAERPQDRLSTGTRPLCARHGADLRDVRAACELAGLLSTTRRSSSARRCRRTSPACSSGRRRIRASSPIVTSIRAAAHLGDDAHLRADGRLREVCLPPLFEGARRQRLEAVVGLPQGARTILLQAGHLSARQQRGGTAVRLGRGSRFAQTGTR